MEYISKSVGTIFTGNDYENLLLPNFQRQFKWNRGKQIKLFSSFIVGIPIGSILLLKGNGGEYAARKLCIRADDKLEEKQCIYLLDGQQRLSTLKSAITNILYNLEDWKKDIDDIYPELQNAWFLKVDSEDEHNDPFGWYNLKFDSENISKNDPEIIEDFISHEKLYKDKNADKWYHPLFEKKLKEKGYGKNRILGDVSEKASNDNLIPLRGILNNLELQERIINGIAKKRGVVLKDLVDDGAEITHKLFDLSIEEYKKLNTETQLEKWSDLKSTWTQKFIVFLERIRKSIIPIIQLEEDEIERAVAIFSNMNKGGTPLTPYDLVVACAAKEIPHNTSLNNEIVDSINKKYKVPDHISNEGVIDDWSLSCMNAIDDKIPRKVIQSQFLNILSMLNFLDNNNVDDIEINVFKKAEILKLDSKQIYNKYKLATKTLIRCFAFLQFRCGLLRVSDLSYELMILPLAVIFMNKKNWNDRAKIDRLEYWYWSSIFSGAYRDRQNKKSLEDIKNVYKWVEKKGENSFLNRYDNLFNDKGYSDFKKLSFQYPDKDIDKAIREGIIQYILSKRPDDFLPKDEFRNEIRLSAYKICMKKEFEDDDGDSYYYDLEKHHIIPLSCEKKVKYSTSKLRQDASHKLNSPLNLTCITSTANRYLSSQSPDEYLKKLKTFSLLKHYIPNDYTKEENESIEKYHLRILKDRFDKIKTNVEDELRDLI